jgi:hypothetical protein
MYRVRTEIWMAGISRMRKGEVRGADRKGRKRKEG